LNLTDADVDLLTFDAAIKSGKLADLERAVALYQGPLLEDCHEEWIPQERAVREQNCLTALLKLGETALTAGDYETAVGYYQRAASLDPWSDTARRGWMEALAKGGDSNAALQVYRKYVEILRSDPSAVPDEQTTSLYQRLRNEARQRANAPSIVVREAAPVPTVTGYLPHPLTDLVGREDERLEVTARMRRSRLVTLTGLGGIGKTRLAIEVASEVAAEYADGVWLVALEALSDGSLVAPQIASVLGVRETPHQTPLQSVTGHLRKKRLLLVLDNCEHLLQASAQVAEHLLRECVGVRILATSREALGITGETVWAVPALTVPDPQHLPQSRSTLLRVLMGYESVQLFVERAQSMRKSFTPTGENAVALAEICSQLEGIPLAIELAAARGKAMTVEQIAERLDNHLSLLTGGSRTAISRQQTLRATLDWSYALLREAERSLLRRLSVFAGGCVLEAAEQVCCGEGIEEEQVLDLLTSLVDKSLVRFEERGQAEGRYRLLEMVRQYAAEGLQASGEADQVKIRHRDWFLALAEEAEPQLKGDGQRNWLRRLETEHDNLRAALARCETEAEGAEAGLRLAGALHRFWYLRGDFNAGQAYFRRALEREEAQEAMAARAKALNGAGNLAYCHGDFVSSRALNEESLTLQRALGDRTGIAVSLNNLADTAYARGDFGEARALYEESLAIRRELEDRLGIANALYGMGNVVFSQGDREEARVLFEESLTIRREVGDKVGIANSLYGLGSVAYTRRDFDMAQTLYEEGLALRREVGDKVGISNSLGGLASAAYGKGDYETARTLLEEELALKRELGDKAGIALILHWLGMVAYATGDYDAARTLLLESLTPFRETGHSGLVHALGLLGHVERDAGDYTRATALYQESLQLRQERGDVLAIAYSLEDFARLAERQGQFERGARLLGAAEAWYTTSGRTTSATFREDYQRTVDAAGAAPNTEALTALWEEGRAMTLEQAVAYALDHP
ncbi:MAG: hypothetical protein JWL77_2170, partial [Chthonomonadaceae bacterium]|nr:hypothetical protein [Chthonomonadaceae bacterium]